jgi:hypothetical protein
MPRAARIKMDRGVWDADDKPFDSRHQAKKASHRARRAMTSDRRFPPPGWLWQEMAEKDCPQPRADILGQRDSMTSAHA